MIYLNNTSFQKNKFVLISIMISTNCSPGAGWVILDSTIPNRLDVFDFLIEIQIHSQVEVWEAQKTEYVALKKSIHLAKNNEDTFILYKINEPAFLRSKIMAYEYPCIYDSPGMWKWDQQFP